MTQDDVQGQVSVLFAVNFSILRIAWPPIPLQGQTASSRVIGNEKEGANKVKNLKSALRCTSRREQYAEKCPIIVPLKQHEQRIRKKFNGKY